MKKLIFSININAPCEKVWNVLWDDQCYKDWTRIFCEGSHAVSDWKEGSKIVFLSDGNNGMFSRIAKKVENEYMSFEHLGEIRNGVEQTAPWENAYENYTLKGENNLTQLLVDLDSTEKFESYFNDTFPKALQRVKELAES
jgi:hypothetical protein